MNFTRLIANEIVNLVRKKGIEYIQKKSSLHCNKLGAITFVAHGVVLVAVLTGTVRALPSTHTAHAN